MKVLKHRLMNIDYSVVSIVSLLIFILNTIFNTLLIYVAYNEGELKQNEEVLNSWMFSIDFINFDFGITLLFGIVFIISYVSCIIQCILRYKIRESVRKSGIKVIA